MDVGECHDGDALDADEDLAGVADALHVAFGAFVEAVRHADAVAGAEAGGVAAQINGAGVGAGNRGGGAEDGHFAVVDAAGALGLQIGVPHHLVIVPPLVVFKEGLGTVDEEQRSDKRLFDISQFAGLEMFLDHRGKVGIEARLAEILLDEGSLAVEYFQCVPVAFFESGLHRCRHIPSTPPSPSFSDFYKRKRAIGRLTGPCCRAMVRCSVQDTSPDPGFYTFAQKG